MLCLCLLVLWNEKNMFRKEKSIKQSFAFNKTKITVRINFFESLGVIKSKGARSGKTKRERDKALDKL